IAILCMGAGWFLFQGPGRNLFGGRSKDATPAPVIADASRPEKTDSDKETTVVPRDNPTPRPNPPGDKPPLDKPPPDKPAPQPPPLGGGPGLTFEKNVLPIFESKCINCHGGGKKRGDLDVRT